MKLQSVLATSVSMLTLAPAALAQNDECTTAVALAVGVATAFDTTAATLSAEPWPCAGGGGPDLWYSFTSTMGGPITIQTCGSTYDTSLEIFGGACGALTSLECNDDACGLQSTVVLAAPTMGTSYFVRVGGYANNTGIGTILLTETGPVANNVSIVNNIPGAWVDISMSGAPLSLSDDGEDDIFTTVGNSLLAPGTVRVGSNGGVRFQGTATQLAYTNNPLPSTGAFALERSLLPFWDDIDTDNGLEGEIYWQEIAGTLIIQWDAVEFYPRNTGGAETATFQIQVHASGSPIAQFLYQDVSGGRANNGGSATIGFQSEDESVNNTAEWSFNTAGSVMDGDVVSIVAGPGTIGTTYCMANPNSSGSAGSMSAIGSVAASVNDVTLTASNLPSFAFGFFITSLTTGFVANPNGSQGNLCVGGAIGRYVGPGQIMNSGGNGEFSLVLDLTMHPQPNGLISVAPGESWSFQAWHRDFVGGAATSNFTEGLTIDFL